MKRLHRIHVGLLFVAMVLLCLGLPQWVEYFLS